jgi:hypothetical protein
VNENEGVAFDEKTKVDPYISLVNDWVVVRPVKIV